MSYVIYLLLILLGILVYQTAIVRENFDNMRDTAQGGARRMYRDLRYGTTNTLSNMKYGMRKHLRRLGF